MDNIQNIISSPFCSAYKEEFDGDDYLVIRTDDAVCVETDCIMVPWRSRFASLFFAMMDSLSAEDFAIFFSSPPSNINTNIDDGELYASRYCLRIKEISNND